MEMCLVCIIQWLAAESPSKDQLTLPVCLSPPVWCETNTMLVNYKFPEKVFVDFLQSIVLPPIHPRAEPSGHEPPGDRRHL